MPVTCRLPRRAVGAAGVTVGVAVAALAAAPLLAGCGTPAARAAGTDAVSPTRLVLVSGRDDHGELAEPMVTLSRTVEGIETVGAVPDGTLARVVASDGQWLEVESVDGTPARGWVDDFRLRGVVHLVGPAPSCAPVMDGHALPPGTQATVLDVRPGGRVRVRTRGLHPATGWVPRGSVRELPPVGPACGDGTDPRTDGHGAGHHH